MPKMSGWEVTKTIKNDPEYGQFKDVPIIMFSAMDDVKDKVEGFELGVDDYITKPYNFPRFLRESGRFFVIENCSPNSRAGVPVSLGRRVSLRYAIDDLSLLRLG